ncbi:MAG: aminotransferase class I/II-fold pyridoxal phosphate-dependent enzyme [Candidatus Woesearchaeota archaeon]|nr:aminotransferase class I/II-fold pyridoxal phosphate-dependent enzyme [Candidatus Woesearchaeota archaeon]
MKQLKAMNAVYSYYFPEVRKLIDDLIKDYPHEIFLTSSNVNLDQFHEPVLEKLLKFYAGAVPDLKNFRFAYPTSGSSEGIREYLTLLQSRGVNQIYVLKGEYEGFKETAKTRNIAAVEIDLEKTSPSKLEKGLWFISNPSARDGNIIPNETIMDICESGHRIFYDMAYVGSTTQYKFDVNHKNIEAAVISLSKPFGLFRYRVGFTFSRNDVPSLYSNKWFKSIPALLIAEKIFDNMEVDELYAKYRPVQKKIIEEINDEFKLAIQPSDAILLGYLPKDDAAKLDKSLQELIAPFERGDNYRFCLTPYYEQKEKEKPK